MLFFLLGVGLFSGAFAGDAIEVSAVRVAQVGGSPPHVDLSFSAPGHLSVSLDCGGRTFSLNLEMTPGGSGSILLKDLAEGTHACRGKARIDQPDGAWGEMPLNFEVLLVPPLDLVVEREGLSLEERRVHLVANRPYSRVDVAVFSLEGKQIGEGSFSPEPSIKMDIEWSQTSDTEVGRILLTAWDIHQLPSVLELWPWSYQIPHEDLLFETGEWTILEREWSKLEAAYDELLAAERRYGQWIDIKLYVAGYTDGVGSKASNMTLSVRRAKAIAMWFRNRGFSHPVFYVGYGEGAPAIQTEDEVSEVRNRRALYIMSADEPFEKVHLPKAIWQRL